MTVETLHPYCETESTRAICAKCGGKCCQRTPGVAWPSDFRPDVEAKVTQLLQTGRWAIRSIDDIYTVSPKGKYPNEHKHLGDFFWGGGPCTFWSKADGCSLPYQERPRECRLLEPRPDNSCLGHSGSWRGARRAWRRYQTFLKQFVEAKDEH